MSVLALSDIAAVTGGHLVGEAECRKVCTDTRQLQPGDLYVALSGENFDGNDFVAQAAERGAVAAVVNRPPVNSLPYIQVKDVRLALGQIARMNRDQFSGPVIALTGSAGKTTCKEMIAAILAECGDVLYTRGNFNNEIGVPLTLLRIAPGHSHAVVEMGAGRSGDIAYLMSFARPDIALVTNALPAHIASFGSVANIAKTKGEIFEGLSTECIALVNLDDNFSDLWLRQAEGRTVVTFSQHNPDADVYAGNIRLQSDGHTQFTLCSPAGEIDVSLPLLGGHNVSNALAAGAASMAAGADLRAVQRGLSEIKAVDGRLKPLVLDGLTVIDDSYNASPGSVKAAIDVLAGFQSPRCLLLGTMGELGQEAVALHIDMASYAKQKGIERFIAVGEFASQMVQAFGSGANSFDTLDTLIPVLDRQLDVAVVLVKGSRFMQMEKAVNALVQSSGEG